MAKSISLKKLRRRRDLFCQMDHPKDLEAICQIPLYRLQMLAIQPKYDIFSIPKRDGSKRWIENPLEPLKSTQKALNAFLQAVYFFHKTTAAFGFVSTCKKDPDLRTILTNAQRHLGCTHLLNIDLEDFFHHVKAPMIAKVLGQAPFSFPDSLVQLLTDLCTHQGRLPMGASTSPVLSNFATYDLDHALLAYCDWAGITYTRFADDMSFSAQREITRSEAERLIGIIEEHAFTLNQEKVKWYVPQDVKYITGLVVTDQIELPADFFPKLGLHISKLQHNLELQYQFRRKPTSWLRKYQQKVEGLLAFASQILGEDHPELTAIETQFSQAIARNDEPLSGSFSWVDFPYL